MDVEILAVDKSTFRVKRLIARGNFLAGAEKLRKLLKPHFVKNGLLAKRQTGYEAKEVRGVSSDEQAAKRDTDRYRWS